MTLKNIIKRCSKLGICEQRLVTDTYYELVFYSKDTGQWSEIFTDMLGQAIKAPGVEPTEDVLSITKDYGGSYGDQTLFKKEFDGVTVIAMFWPWRNGIATTLKVIALER